MIHSKIVTWQCKIKFSFAQHTKHLQRQLKTHVLLSSYLQRMIPTVIYQENIPRVCSKFFDFIQIATSNLIAWVVHEEMCAVIRKELSKERKVNPVQACATCTDMIMYDILSSICKHYHAPTFYVWLTGLSYYNYNIIEKPTHI